MNSTFSILKKAVITFSFFCFLNAAAQVQVVAAPEKMSYQAVIRNASNNLVASQAVGMQISILKASATGTAVYVETQTPTTNANGLVSLQIGSGTLVSGAMGTIDWSQGPYFIKTETDPTGGTNYTITGTSQLLSVPYALYAKTSGSSTPGPQGIQGATGPAGQGVPTGGTANQVLAKVNGTDYNTQWVTPASGGGTGATLALLATKTSDPQILPAATALSDVSTQITYQTASTNVTAIGTFDNTGIFNVVQQGLYYVQAVTRSVDATTPVNTTNHNLYISIDNGGMVDINSFHQVTHNTVNNGYYVSGVKGKGYVSGIYFLTAGQTIRIKGFSNNSSTTSAALKTDGSCQLMIVKL